MHDSNKARPRSALSQYLQLKADTFLVGVMGVFLIRWSVITNIEGLRPGRYRLGRFSVELLLIPPVPGVTPSLIKK